MIAYNRVNVRRPSLWGAMHIRHNSRWQMACCLCTQNLQNIKKGIAGGKYWKCSDRYIWLPPPSPSTSSTIPIVHDILYFSRPSFPGRKHLRLQPLAQHFISPLHSASWEHSLEQSPACDALMTGQWPVLTKAKDKISIYQFQFWCPSAFCKVIGDQFLFELLWLKTFLYAKKGNHPLRGTCNHIFLFGNLIDLGLRSFTV